MQWVVFGQGAIKVETEQHAIRARQLDKPGLPILRVWGADGVPSGTDTRIGMARCRIGFRCGLRFRHAQHPVRQDKHGAGGGEDLASLDCHGARGLSEWPNGIVRTRTN